MPRKIRQILKDYTRAGYFVVPGAGKGDHRKLKHPAVEGSYILDGKAGSDCKHYQEKDLKSALKQLKK